LPQTADKGWHFALVLGKLTTPDYKKDCHEVLHGDWVNVLERLKMNMRFGTWNVRGGLILLKIIVREVGKRKLDSL
jgi:hypothetical protein